MALAAAMRPKWRGLSTMGMKKSVVTTMACVSFSLYLQDNAPERACFV
jgi:hypothetical protein